MTNGDFVIGLYSDEKFKKIVCEKAFIQKLTLKIHSSLSNINICYYLQFRIPIRHRKFLKTISQKPDIVKTHCIDL